MSELKARRAYFSEDEYDKGAHKICAKVSDCGYDRRNDWWSYAFEDEVYLKSEADKVIAELEDKLRHYPIMTALIESCNKEIAELQKQVHDYAQGLYVIQAKAEKEVRHQKYKRCLAMAKYCEAMRGHYLSYEEPKWFWYRKWSERWLELAELFKEVK